jgi:fatty acid desaturase
MQPAVELHDRSAIHALQAQRPAELVRRFVVEWTQIVAFYWLAYRLAHPLGYVVATLLIGLRQHGLALLGHDGAHQLFSRNKRVNDLVANALCFWPLGAALEGYRAFHLQHHKQLGTEQDPELGFVAYEVPTTRRHIACRALLDLFGLGAAFSTSFIAKVRAERLAHRLAPIVWQVAMITVCYATGQLWIAGIWFAAQLTSFSMAFRLRAGFEHHGLRDGTHRFEPTLLSRHVYLPHNTHCHYEHHRYASVPCYSLPALRNVIDQHVPIGRERDVLETLAARPL